MIISELSAQIERKMKKSDSLWKSAKRLAMAGEGRHAVSVTRAAKRLDDEVAELRLKLAASVKQD
ncbi:hypothetical protein HA052_04290 [Chromobacterium haemolyticum]|uniref:Uncharacterized protein n=1 Tax=Chromobacterium fluminis TaxID=3044269 RepID=A0ABX0L4K8_9NEIS|nr:hypothetical protein [Chromobacterium haemolyticum]NHR04409.1 hypothetical protein [Chromobacterium haemolyticum]